METGTSFYLFNPARLDSGNLTEHDTPQIGELYDDICKQMLTTRNHYLQMAVVTRAPRGSMNA